MLILYWGMVAVGMAGIVWGLPAAHRWQRPYDIVAALVVLAGLVLALLGALLVVVPGFFAG